MPRGPYAKVSAADRARIVECADGGGDWKALCANLRVNPKTAHGWVKSGAQERRPHAGGRRKALTEEQVDAICGMIEEDQGITLKALKERILVDFQLNVAISTIHNYLEGRLLTIEEGALHRGRCKQCKKQGPACGICASNQCPYAGKQDNYLDGRNEHQLVLSAHARKSSSWPANCSRFAGIQGSQCPCYWRHHKFPSRQMEPASRCISVAKREGLAC